MTLLSNLYLQKSKFVPNCLLRILTLMIIRRIKYRIPFLRKIEYSLYIVFMNRHKYPLNLKQNGQLYIQNQYCNSCIIQSLIWNHAWNFLFSKLHNDFMNYWQKVKWNMINGCLSLPWPVKLLKFMFRKSVCHFLENGKKWNNPWNWFFSFEMLPVAWGQYILWWQFISPQ